MKKIYISIISLFLSLAVFGQTTTPTTTKNYVHKTSYKKGVQESAIGSVSENNKLETISYFDGLGRPIQSVAIRQGGKDANQRDTDLIVPIAYDGYGRQAKEYLPYYSSNNTGSYDSNAIVNARAFNEAEFGAELNLSHSNPYTEKAFSNSPLNRILKQASPGEAWKMGSGHEVKFDYKTNTSNEVKRFYVVVNSNYSPTLMGGNFYASNKLYKNIVIDENHSGTTKNRTTEEFKDKQGRVVLKRTYNNNQKHDTYYVYDDFGNLTFVLPPLMNASTSSLSVLRTKLAALGYQYKYDYRNRLIEKQLPGKGREYIVYNKLDQPIMTQDANLKAQHKWLFTKYDVFGRVAYTGVTNSNASRATLQLQANNTSTQWVTKTGARSAGGTTVYYSNGGYPTTVSEILTINYYDNYLFNYDGLKVPSSTTYTTTIDGTKLKGLATGSKVKVLGTNKWITTVTGYDQERRPVWIANKNTYLSTIDYIESKFKNTTNDISGLLRETKTRHYKTGKPLLVTIDKFTYNHTGKMTRHSQKINKLAEETLVKNDYDVLGRLAVKRVGGTPKTEYQVVDYSYNIRGWLTEINDIGKLGKDLFAFKISYNSPTSGIALYNGNISEIQWKTQSANPSKNAVSNRYNFSYDHLNRLTKAIDNTGHYNLDLVQYDKNGNIKKLKRKGHINASASSFGVMDDLTYTYDTGNRLMKVSDAASIDRFGFKDDAVNTTYDGSNDYTYDQNGNMKTDTNKGITSIVYNHLNLPTEIKFNNSNTKKINYIYDALGTKLRKVVRDNSNIKTTDYAGGYVYENNNLQFFNTEEGYFNVISSSGTLQGHYVYQYKDHLGNVRLTWYYDQAWKKVRIIEENNYYPFGLEQRGYHNYVNPNGNAAAQKYKYNGKELEESLGLNLYEMDMRGYDPAIARWTSIDPVTHHTMSTYNAFDNNPVYWADPSGADTWTHIKDGKYRNNETGEETYDWQRAVSETVETVSGDTGGDPKYKGKNFDYKGNLEKINSGDYTDGGHWMGSGNEPKYFYNKVSHEFTSKVEFLFKDAATIEKWNELGDEYSGNVNNLLSAGVGFLASRLGASPSQGAIVGFIQNKWFSLGHLNIFLNPGDKLVTESKISIIRSVMEGDGYNGIQLLTSIYVQTSNNNKNIITSNLTFIQLNPITNKSDSRLLIDYENRTGSTKIINNPLKALGLNLHIKRSN